MTDRTSRETGKGHIAPPWCRGAVALLLAVITAALVISASASAAPVSCGNRVYDKEAVFSFSLTRLRAGEEKGHRFVQYQLHIQAFAKYTANIAYTWLRAASQGPNGKPTVGADDSRLKAGRKNHMPWYAHFRIKVKPGAILTYKGYLRLNVAIPVPRGRITGFHYNGTCSAR
jgi:hypothetical protein